MTTNVGRALMVVAAWVAVTGAGLGQDQRHPLECPSTWQRDPLLGRRGWQGKGPEPIPEGRSILLDSDSHPRRPAKLVRGPEVRRQADGVQVWFALDAADDVIVRVVDGKGDAVRTLGCGVLGPNAPEPFRKDSLKQEIAWDGKDAAGKAAPAGCRIEVAVGLRPVFDRFVGYRPGLPNSWVIGLEVDPAGRLYAAFMSEAKSDPTVLRYDRQGKCRDMVFPCSPAAIGARPLELLYPFTEMIDGRPVPTRLRAWTSHTPAGQPHIGVVGPFRQRFPLRIDAGGNAWFAELNTGGGGSSLGYQSKAVLQRFYPITDLDRFWLRPTVEINDSDGGFALDGRGFAYIATRTYAGWGIWPPPSYFNDKNAPGTIRKVNLRTGALAPDFDFNGTEQRSEKSAYLGTARISSAAVNWRTLRARTEPDPAVDGPSLLPDICDLTVDDQGRILVADGYPRRVKVYRPDGFFLGEVAALKIAGQARRFSQIRTVRAWGDSVFYLVLFADQNPEKIHLVKTAGDPARPTVVWHVALHSDAWHLAVDSHTTPALVWVGNGDGPATITRIEDRGDKPGEVRNIRGTPLAEDRVLLSPWAIAAAPDGTLFVHDHGRKALVRTDAEMKDWREMLIDQGPDDLSDPKQASSPTALCYDAAHDRLLVTYQTRLRCFSRDLVEDKAFRLEPAVTEEVLRRRLAGAKRALTAEQVEQQVAAWKRADAQPWSGPASYGPMPAADRQGNLYVTDAARDLPFVAPDIIRALSGGQRGDFYGVVRKYRPDGTIENHALCRLYQAGGSIALDSRGNIYTFGLPQGDWEMFVHNFPLHHYGPAAWLDGFTMTRGGRPVTDQSQICHLLKFGPSGGQCGAETELWAHRGVSVHSGGSCTCRWPANLLTVDGADRVIAADSCHLHLKVFDTAGNLICRIGTWGNAETVPADGDASVVGFHNIHGLAAAGDTLYVSDQGLRRIAKFRMAYRDMRTAPLPPASPVSEAPKP